MTVIGLTQRVEVLADRGVRRDCLDQAWATWLDALGFRPVPIPNGLSNVGGFVAATRIEGIILTGGNDLATSDAPRNAAPERDRLEHALIDLAIVSGIPLLGVCRGMQMLAAHEGVTLSAVEGHVRRRHALNVSSGSIMPLRDGRTVNSFHDYGIHDTTSLGADWCVCARAPDGTLEAIAHRARPHWGIMWHPEREPVPREDDLIASLFEGHRPCDA